MNRWDVYTFLKQSHQAGRRIPSNFAYAVFAYSMPHDEITEGINEFNLMLKREGEHADRVDRQPEQNSVV